uniref:Uncharacterized protein n=1 Tax=Strigamia maritima TaxID=126957 RepID=T1IMD2_STRMM
MDKADLYVADLCVGDLCVGDLCVGDLCVGDLCVGDLCIGDLCVGDLDDGDLDVFSNADMRSEVAMNEWYEARKTRYYLKFNKPPNVPSSISFSTDGDVPPKSNKVKTKQISKWYQITPCDQKREIRGLKKPSKLTYRVSSRSKSKIVHIVQNKDYADKDYKIKRSRFPEIEAPEKKREIKVKESAPKVFEVQDTCTVCDNRQLNSVDHLPSIADAIPEIEGRSSIEILLKELNSKDDIHNVKEWNSAVYPLPHDFESESRMFSSDASFRLNKFSKTLNKKVKFRQELLDQKIKKRRLRVTKQILFCGETYYESEEKYGNNRMMDDQYIIPIVIRENIVQDDDEEREH